MWFSIISVCKQSWEPLMVLNPLISQMRKIRLWNIKQKMSQKELVADPGQESRFPVTHRLPETLFFKFIGNFWEAEQNTLLRLTPRNVMFVFKNQASSQATTSSTNEALSYKCLTFKRNKKAKVPRHQRAFLLLLLSHFSRVRLCATP